MNAFTSRLKQRHGKRCLWLRRSNDCRQARVSSSRGNRGQVIEVIGGTPRFTEKLIVVCPLLLPITRQDEGSRLDSWTAQRHNGTTEGKAFGQLDGTVKCKTCPPCTPLPISPTTSLADQKQITPTPLALYKHSLQEFLANLSLHC